MGFAPGGDVVVVVTVGDGAADHQQKNLGQRVQDPPHIAGVVDRRGVFQQDGEAGLLGKNWQEWMTCVRLRIGEPDRINPLHACQPLLHEFGAPASPAD
jgi:hypothetical protein